MSLTTTTHLNFRGNARAALAFYHGVFGGDLSLVTNQDAHEACAPGEAEQVKWGQVASPEGFRLMAYDVPAHMPWHQGDNAVYVVVQGSTADEVTAYWGKLCDGAAIVQPLLASAWAPLSGMLQDKFGVVWVLSVVAAYGAP